MSGMERNRLCARRWLNFMWLGGVREEADMVRHHRSRYTRVEGRTVYVYLAQVSR